MLAILILMSVLLIWDRLPAWLVFMGTIAVCMTLGCSYAFINPSGYQINLMVQAPGNYGFIDCVKVGLLLTIVVGIVAIALAPMLYGF